MGYLASFFGGPVAGAIVALANASRLKRLRRDWFLLPTALLVEILYLLWLRRDGAGWIEGMDLSPTVPWRLLGLLFFAAIYFLHRRYYRSMEVLGIKAASGWVVGILALVAGIAVWGLLNLWLDPQ